MPVPKITNVQRGDVNPKDLPTKPLHLNAQPVSHVFDFIENAACGLVNASYRDAVSKGQYNSLPAPLSPASTPDIPF
eukprot:10752527-Lingulodinium_polyedra.AAC.1